MKYNIISHAKKDFFSLHFSTSRNMTRKKKIPSTLHFSISNKNRPNKITS